MHFHINLKYSLPNLLSNSYVDEEIMIGSRCGCGYLFNYLLTSTFLMDSDESYKPLGSVFFSPCISTSNANNTAKTEIQTYMKKKKMGYFFMINGRIFHLKNRKKLCITKIHSCLTFLKAYISEHMISIAI